MKIFSKILLALFLFLAILLLPAPAQVTNPPGGGGGPVTFDQVGSGTNTSHGLVVGNGSVLTPSSGGFINANEVNGATIPASTSVVGTNASGQLIASSAAASLKPIFQFLGFGDSYMAGVGVADPGQQSFFSLLTANIAAPATNYGISGGTGPSVVALEAVPNWAPSPTVPSLAIMNAGQNDANGDTCGGTLTSGCAYNYSLSMSAAEGWVAETHILASNAAQTGGWATDAPVPIYTSPIYASTGTYAHSATSGATLTFTIPASSSPEVSLMWYVNTGNAGTFTVSVDGSAQNYVCNSTTSFTVGGCQGVAINNLGATYSWFRQQFTVTPGGTHTIIITLSSANDVGILAAGYVPTTLPANQSTVIALGPNAIWTNSANYEILSANVANQLLTAGLPVYYASQQSGTPGVNATTDISTTATGSCSGSTAANHPNTCGYVNAAATITNRALATGMQFFSYNKNPTPINPIFTIPLTNTSAIVPGPRATSFSNWNPNSGNPSNGSWGLGIDWLRGLNNSAGIGWGFDTSSNLPYSSAFITKTFSSLGWDCKQSTPSNTLLTTNAENQYTSTFCTNFATGGTISKGVAGYIVGSVIASAATISPTAQIFHVNGIATISTITPPSNFNALVGGCLTIIADSIWSTITGGNIASVLTSVASTPYSACYDGSLWYIK